jgi:MFS family permease
VGRHGRAGVASGPVTGGLLLEHFYWGSVFWALVPLALAAAVLGFLLVPESRDPSAPALDIRGLTTSIAFLGVLVYTVIEAPNCGWDSHATLIGFAIALGLACVFVAVERAAEHPMLDVGLFTDRRFSAASAAVTVTFFALSGFIFLITQYFQVVREFGPLSTGVRILPVALIAVGSILGGLLAPRVGTRAVVVTGLLSFGTAMAWIAGTVETHTPYWTTIVPQMLCMGLIATPATESIMLVLPPSRAGVGSAVNDATRELSATLGVAVIGSVFSSIFGARLLDSAFAATGKAAEAADSVPVAFGIAAANPACSRSRRTHSCPASPWPAQWSRVCATRPRLQAWSRCPAGGSSLRSRPRRKSRTRWRWPEPSGRRHRYSQPVETLNCGQTSGVTFRSVVPRPPAL